MDIICFGDSLTFGSVGHSYIKYLKKATDCKLVNKGVNEDTTIPLYTRLERHIGKAKRKCTYIVCIGTNDLLLPYLTSVSTLWKMQIFPRVRYKHCISDNALFEKDINVVNISGLNNISPALYASGLESLAANTKVFSDIANEIAKPLRRNDSPLEYLPTQYITEFIKSKGYSGVEFSSTMATGGTNIAVFDETLFECIGVQNVEIKKIEYLYDSIT